MAFRWSNAVDTVRARVIFDAEKQDLNTYDAAIAQPGGTDELRTLVSRHIDRYVDELSRYDWTDLINEQDYIWHTPVPRPSIVPITLEQALNLTLKRELIESVISELALPF